jgi:hypothetical protein
MEDTDSMAIVARKRGGLVPCPGGPHPLPDGREAIQALTWAQVASYSVTGDSFSADRPQPWSEQRFVVGRHFDLHPDGERVALAVVRESGATKQDKVVFIFNFFDELRRIAPTSSR